MTTPRGSSGAGWWVTIEGVGFWASGLPDWDAAKAFAAGAASPEGAPVRPAPRLLAPNEQRRAPETVAVALEVAWAACRAAGRDAASLPSVFASTHGDLAVTDYMCAALASDPRSVSPIKFHNSVHNAAAGYWTIGVGATQSATALSAYGGSFAQGLIEAAALLAAGAEATLLVAYDGEARGPLAQVSPSEGLLGGALVLARTATIDAPRLRLKLEPGDRTSRAGPLERHSSGNAMAQMLPLFDALAVKADGATLAAGAGQILRVELAADRVAA